ncbi:MAG TPA: hypothetical protein VGP13_00685 [Candidatus Paceibacterota bacterium]|jgi:gas vesicle protein|nr:hypothetical protein [Candidatus Paceibacterota bacterium]
MKQLIAALVSLVLLTPAFALADQGPSTANLRAGIHAQVDINGTKAEVHGGAEASTTNRGPGSMPKLGAEIRKVASSTRDVIKKKLDNLRDLIEQHRETMKERGDNAKEKAKERFGDKVEQLVGHVSDRLASTSAQLNNISTRISARIDTLESAGTDMSAPADLLATAQTDLSAANDKIAAVNVELEAAMGTSTPKADIPAVRAAVKAAEDALMLVKDDLGKTLRSIKAQTEATTTVSH